MALPTRPCGLYWAYWSPVQRLVDFPTTYNVIFLFHAVPVGGAPGSTGAVTLNKPTGAPGTNYNADIQTCRNRGQRIIMTVGGAGAQLTLNTQQRADVFIQSFKTINDSLKTGTSLAGTPSSTKAIDGLDWNNFEGANISGQSTWMTYVGQQLKAFYGDFIISSPPAAFGGGQDVTDRTLLATLYKGGALDWVCPQFYDPSDLNTVSNVRYYLDFYNTAVTISGTSVQIPRNNIGIGFGIKSGAASNSRWSTAGAASCYSTMVSEGKNPRGAFNWAAYEDPTSLFASQVGPTINPDLTGDTTAPTVGTGPFFTSTTDTSTGVFWSNASDNATATSSLQYELRRSLSSNMSTVALAESNGTIAMAYSTATTSATVSSLSPSTTYYFTVIVKDGAGNKAVYSTGSVTTNAPPTVPSTRLVTNLSSVTGLSSITI